MQKLNRFSGRLLGAFLELADSQQFKLAAERMHVSQSAFSQMIARLESEMGARLFIRDTRQVALTPEGQILLPMARMLAGQVDALYLRLREHVERRQGKVAIAALPSLSADWLPAILARYRARYPGITIQFFDTVPDDNIELVRRGAVDFAINARVDHPEEFDTSALFSEPFYLVCPPDHPFAGRKSVLLRALAGHAFVHTSRSGSIWHWLDPHIRELKLQNTGFEVGHLSTLAGLVANGIGISIVPGTGLPQFLRLGLVAVPIRDRKLERPLLIVKRRGHGLSIAAQALLRMIVEHPPQHVVSRPLRKRDARS